MSIFEYILYGLSSLLAIRFYIKLIKIRWDAIEVFKEHGDVDIDNLLDMKDEMINFLKFIEDKRKENEETNKRGYQ